MYCILQCSFDRDISRQNSSGLLHAMASLLSRFSRTFSRLHIASQKHSAAVRTVWQNFVAGFRQWLASVSQVLRAWGLQSLTFLAYDQSRPEGPKYVLRKSFWIGTGRCFIHIVPAAFCIFLTYVNLLDVYIGPGFTIRDRYDGGYFIAFQIAAKLLELFSIASMGAILLQVLRHDMLHGQGVPLGLLTSHLWCTSPQSVISPEYLTACHTIVKDVSKTVVDTFWGRCKSWTIIQWHWRRIRLFVLISIAIVITSSIGPFSAVLLIPRDQLFPAGGTKYNLDATATELWPGNVTSDLELDVCSFENATVYPICPSGSYPTARDRWTLSDIYDSDGFRPSVDGSNFGWAAYNSIDPWGVLPTMAGRGNDRKGPIGGYMPTAFAQINAYTAVMFQTLMRDWFSAAREASNNDENRHGALQSPRSFVHAGYQGSVISRYPVTSVRCSLPQNLSAPADTFNFHRFDPYANASKFVDSMSWSDDNHTSSVSIAHLQRQPISHVRTQWVDLPIDVFYPRSTGLLFEMPWAADNTSRVAVSCTAVAAWCTSWTSTSADYTMLADWAGCFGKPTKELTDDMDVDWMSYNRHTALDRSWLDLLTPPAPASSAIDPSWQPSTLDMILEAAGFGSLMQDLRLYDHYIWINDTCGVGRLDASLSDLDLWNGRVCNRGDYVIFIERTVARLITDGLSRRLSHRAFNMMPRISSWIVDGIPRTDDYNRKLLDINQRQNAVNLTSDSTKLVQQLAVQVTGLGYQAKTRTDHIAIGIVCSYAFMSILYVLWTCFWRISSSAWDSAIELLVLAWNSPQVPQLKATSAQIERWKTYRLVAKINAKEAAANGASNQPEEYLQLILEEPPPVRGAGGSTQPVFSTSLQQLHNGTITKRVVANKKYY